MTNFLIGLGILAVLAVCFFLYCIASELAGIREALEEMLEKDEEDDSSEED